MDQPREFYGQQDKKIRTWRNHEQILLDGCGEAIQGPERECEHQKIPR